MLLSEIVLCSSLSTKYCPGGTSDEKLVFNLENDNIQVEYGYYSTPEDSFPRTSEELCPLGHYCQYGIRKECEPGSYGGTTGLAVSTCSGLCTAGYYCHAASPSATQYDCGSANVYCPEGSS